MTDAGPAREPVLRGEITRDGMLGIIQEVERLRTTGVLLFESGEVRGEVDLIAGQIAVDQRDMADGRDPVETLLELRSGTYEVYQRLPPLPVSKGDDLTRTGSLAVHVPADLMNYCEHAGMTGALVFENQGRSAEIVYHAGNLVAIRIEGEDEQDLHEVFGWEEGTFQIRAQSQRPPVLPEAPEAAPPPAAAPKAPKVREETGQHFLRSVEVALVQIVEEREKRRSPTRTGPQLPPQRRARPPTLPGIEPVPEPRTKPAKRRREPTVQVIYLSAQREADERGVRHAGRDVMPEHALPEAQPERRGGTAEAPSVEPGERVAEARPHTLAGTLAWVLVVVVLIVGALGLLASLPAIE